MKAPLSGLGEPLKKARVLRRDHGANVAQLLAELTLFAAAVVVTYYDDRFERELADGIHDHRLGGSIRIEHGSVFFEALERRYQRSSTTWVSPVCLS
jgi:hypothetical protein